MAKRRAIAAGIGSALQDFAKLQYQHQLQMQAQAAARDATFANQRQQAILGIAKDLIPAIKAGQVRAEAIPEEMRQVLGGAVDFDALTPSSPQRYAPISEAIAKASDFGSLPTEEDIRGQAAGLGGDVGKVWGMVSRPSQGGELPSTVNQAVDRPDIQTLLDQAKARREAIINAHGLEDDRKLAMVEGEEKVRGRAQNELANTFLPDVIRRNTAVGNNETEIQKNRLTALGPVQATNAARQAGAVRRAELAPDIVDREVEKAQRIADAQASVQATSNPTDTQRRAASQLPILLDSIQNIASLEAKNKNLGWTPGLMSYMQSPLLATGRNMLGLGPDAAHQAYAQAGMNAASIITFILSGQQTRAEELPRIATTMFAMEGDSPAIRAQKAKTRESFLSAIQMQAGKSQYDLGRTLGQMVKEGRLDGTLLSNLHLADDVKGGLEDFFNGR